jgi:hypothetical protein
VGVDTVADVSDAPATSIFRIEVDPEYGGSMFHRNFSDAAHFHTVEIPMSRISTNTESP